MKVALLLAVHERPNIFPHYGMKVFSDNSCALFILSPRLDKDDLGCIIELNGGK
jgi:hypothetical protein